MGKQVAGVAPEVTAFLMNRSWRGNVRELEHVIESAMNVVEDGQTVELEHLPIYLSEVDELEEDTPEHSPREAVSLNEALAAYEKKLILAAMKASNWKIVDAAARLRIPRTSLQYKLENTISSDGNSSSLRRISITGRAQGQSGWFVPAFSLYRLCKINT